MPPFPLPPPPLFGGGVDGVPALSPPDDAVEDVEAVWVVVSWAAADGLDEVSDDDVAFVSPLEECSAAPPCDDVSCLAFFWRRRERCPLDEEVDGCDDEEVDVSEEEGSLPPEDRVPVVKDDDAVALSSGEVSAGCFWVSS
ncbi:hypothetical protein LPL18_016290 [Halomonas sp. CUBES01]|uniref:hypothetical protein n=1 Tax=Halomonas sp. CUBES01 TaxID=2897340 RepID=UPI001E5514EA|nr:hypothetical protein [Halomonas sp. CUBES01]MEC4768890.1 hypothetical protein [Halomonas sp. CUBES01]